MCFLYRKDIEIQISKSYKCLFSILVYQIFEPNIFSKKDTGFINLTTPLQNLSFKWGCILTICALWLLIGISVSSFTFLTITAQHSDIKMIFHFRTSNTVKFSRSRKCFYICLSCPIYFLFFNKYELSLSSSFFIYFKWYWQLLLSKVKEILGIFNDYLSTDNLYFLFHWCFH